MTSWAERSWAAGPWADLPRAVRGLLLLTVGTFLFQWLADEFTGGAFTRVFGLSLLSLRRGFIWQPATYVFLHGSFFHLLMNMLILFFLGPETERFLGLGRFLLLYIVSGVLGGIGWLLIEPSPLAVCIGASGAVFGILGAFAALFPDQPITVLLFFLVPVTLRAWVLAAILGVIELMALISPRAGNVAYAAHLAGGLAGYFYALGLVRGARPPDRGSSRFIRRFFERRIEDDTAELDRILDKIAREGWGRLTRRERDRLERASRSRRGV